MSRSGKGRDDDVDDAVSDELDDVISNIQDIEGWTGWPQTDAEARDIVAGFIDQMTDVGADQGHTVVALAVARLLRSHSRS